MAGPGWNGVGTFVLGSLGGVPPWMYVLLLGLAALALVVPRKLARRSKILTRENVSETERLKRSMEELLIQLQEVAREVNATLDTKMIALNQLVEDAEARIDELKELLEKAPTGASKGTGEPSEDPVQDGRRREVEEMVLRLVGEGKTELEIAQETGIPRGEIELVLALRRKASGQ